MLVGILFVGVQRLAVGLYREGEDEGRGTLLAVYKPLPISQPNELPALETLTTINQA